jgi:hypothetical protein
VENRNSYSFDRSILKRPGISKMHPLQEIVPNYIDSSCRNFHSDLQVSIVKNLVVTHCVVFNLEVGKLDYLENI